MMDDDLIPSYPDRIMEETSAGFTFGMFCGLFSHPVKSIFNLPQRNVSSITDILKASPQAALTNIPRLGGRFAAFSTIWIALRCAMDHYHGKHRTVRVLHDCIALPATVALFKCRTQGFRVASRSAFRWGSAYAIFQGTYELLEHIDSELNYAPPQAYWDDYVPFPPPVSSDNVVVEVPQHKSGDVPAPQHKSEDV